MSRPRQFERPALTSTEPVGVRVLELPSGGSVTLTLRTPNVLKLSAMERALVDRLHQVFDAYTDGADVAEFPDPPEVR